MVATPSGPAENQAAGGNPGTGGHHHILDILHRVHRGSANLAHGFADAVHAVDVGLAELSAVGVDGQASPELDVAVADEVLRFALLAEAELLELGQDKGGEVVVDDRGLDIVGCEPGGCLELFCHESHLR